LFFESFDLLQKEFAGAAVFSYFEDSIAVLVSFLVGVPLMVSVLKLKILGKADN
jgi:hypothetical protein